MGPRLRKTLGWALYAFIVAFVMYLSWIFPNVMMDVHCAGNCTGV